MNIVTLTFAAVVIFGSFAEATTFGTADKTSYIITLNQALSEQQLDRCMKDICELSGDQMSMECEIISKRARIAAAGLSNRAAKKVGALECVKSLRQERFDFEPRPRVGRSN